MDDVENTVLRLFDQFTDLDDREAASLAPEVLRVAKERVAEEITSLLSDAEISQLFIEKTDAAMSFEADIALVADTDTLNQEELENARKNVPRDAKMGQVALRFLTRDQTGDPQPSEVPQPPDPSEASARDVLPNLFHGEAQQVAERLVGKRIENGDFSVIVASTLPQTEEDNQRWLASRPLFGEDPVDVYVAGYRGNPMLFFRVSETNSCVRISSAVDPSSGEPFLNPKQVCKALGLSTETVGHASVRDNVVTIQIDGDHIKPSAK